MATGKNVKRNKNLKAVFNFSHRESYHDYMGRRMREENAKEKMLDSPINNLQQLMAITAEECGELTQSCMKIMRKFDSFDQLAGDPYTTQLVDELGDVQCMIELMIDHGIVGHKDIAQRAEFKREKLKTWSTLINK